MKKKYIISFLFMIIVIPFLKSQDISSDLLGYWSFNESFDDISVNNLNGTENGTIVFEYDWLDNPNSSARFNGSNTTVALNHSELLNLGENFTISAWIKLLSYPSISAYIFSSLDAVSSQQTKGIGFGINVATASGRNANSLSFTNGNNVWEWDIWTSPTNSVSLNTWCHVAVTVENSSSSNKTVKFYLDGSEISALKWSAGTERSINWGNNTVCNRIGGSVTTISGYLDDRYIDGNIANLRIYTRALTNSEINAVITDDGTPPSPPAINDWQQSGDDIFYNGLGNIGIGTDNPPAKLTVDGPILATEIKVKTDVSTFPDFVFLPDYNLRTLQETETYILQNGHLPDIPSALQVGEEGLSLGEMDAKLLQKIEELTLYMIEMKKENEELKREIEILKN